MTKLNPDALEAHQSRYENLTDKEGLEFAWACIVGGDIAAQCFNVSIIRGDLANGIGGYLAWQAALPKPPDDAAQPEQARTEGVESIVERCAVIADGHRISHPGRDQWKKGYNFCAKLIARDIRAQSAAPSPAPRSVEQAAPVEVAEVWDHENADREKLGEHYTRAVDLLTRRNVFAKSEVAKVIALHSRAIAQLREEVERLEDSAHRLAADKIGLENDLTDAEERADKAETRLALVEPVVTAARKMPRATPAPGGAGTEHTFTLTAATVWALDAAFLNLDAALPESAPKEE